MSSDASSGEYYARIESRAFARAAKQVARGASWSMALSDLTHNDILEIPNPDALRKRVKRWQAAQLKAKGFDWWSDKAEVKAPVDVTSPAAPPVDKSLLSRRIPPAIPLLQPWTEGTPPRLTLVTSDDHFPFHDQAYQRAKVQLAADLKVDCWFDLGDHYDFEGISDYDRDPAHGLATLQDELDSSVEHWRRVCSIAPRVEYILGNHEDRLYRKVMASPALYGLRALTDFNRLADIPSKVKVWQFNTQRWIGLLCGMHGHEWSGKNPTHDAMQHHNARLIAFGHTHRPGMYGKQAVLEDGTGVVRREVYNLGFGAETPDKSPPTARWARALPHWTRSFLLVWQFDGQYRVDVVRWEHGQMSYAGKVYRGV